MGIRITEVTTPSWLTVVDNGDNTFDLDGTVPSTIGALYDLTVRLTDNASGLYSPDMTYMIRAVSGGAYQLYLRRRRE